jgi:hypothetical protein
VDDAAVPAEPGRVLVHPCQHPRPRPLGCVIGGWTFSLGLSEGLEIFSVLLKILHFLQAFLCDFFLDVLCFWNFLDIRIGGPAKRDTGTFPVPNTILAEGCL